ncbi:MAG: DegT/DnrJ/EryC1/StrS family aminotransferase [Desulfovibrio sp.]|jgi:perosamine synthetase|nr:DegT/DnrJ/EryC1/StrS family aminotransferase [Desulfovibrio sp.]
MIPHSIALNSFSATQRDIECVVEALSSGRGTNAAAAVRAFQRNMARCVGREYAYAVSGGRAAFFLALRAMGIGPGDEVLLPEGADFAPAAAVLHCGAVPVFCDLDPATFTLDPQSVAARIGPRSRCVVAAHMYGLPADMPALEDLARKHGLFLLEDASSGFGGLRQGRAVGSFGDVSVFNFKDVSLIHTGEGGMLLSSSKDLIGRAARLGGEGRSASDPLVYDIAGHDFAVSNLTAALGLAQLERLKELLERKARIFMHYRERLGAVPGLRLNPEIPGTRNSYLMPFIILEQGGAGDLARRLHSGRVASRPALTPLSSMPLFKKADNPAAYEAADRLLLLPGGQDLAEDEVEHVASCVTMLLRDPGLRTARPALTGRLKYRAVLPAFFDRIKLEGCALPFTHNKRNYALRIMTPAQADDPRFATALGELRAAGAPMLLHSPVNAAEETAGLLKFYKSPAATAFLLFLIREEDEADAAEPSPERPKEERGARGDGAAGPLPEQAEGERVKSGDGATEPSPERPHEERGESGVPAVSADLPPWGYVALSGFDFTKAECDVEGPFMSAAAPKGLAAAACGAFFIWCRNALHLTRVFTRIRASDTKTMRLASTLGFVPRHRISLRAQALPGRDALGLVPERPGKGRGTAPVEVLRPMYLPGHDKPDDALVIAARDL